MILELLVTLIFGLAQLIIDLIPEFDLDSGFIAGFSKVGAIMDGVSYLLPVGTFLGCLSVFFLLQNTTLLLSILNWIIRKIPGVN